MFKNYLLVAFRNLLKHRNYVIINVLGLGVSIACCISAYLFIAFNIEFDNFHSDAKVQNIFAVHTLSKDLDGKPMRDFQAPTIMAPIAAEDIAGIENYTRFISGGGALRYEDKAFSEYICFSDSTFFDLFEFPFVTGSSKSFKEKNTIILSEKLAKKYFGDNDPVGKMMTFKGPNESEFRLFVGGVVKKIPINSTLPFDAMMRFEHFMAMNKISNDDWTDWRNPSTFFQVASARSAAGVSKAMDKYIPVRNKARTDMVIDNFALVPFKEPHVYGDNDLRYGWTQSRLNVAPILVFCGLAAMILLIACFNLTNTSIAMTTKRLKEVGIRKAIGAARRNIIQQFLLETFIMICLSVVVAVAIAQLIVPVFSAMWLGEYGMNQLSGMNSLIALLLLVFVTSLIAGIYPALSGSGFKPTALLKGTVKTDGASWLSHSLVAFQFALSVLVLIGGVTFIRNARYQEKIQFGYDRDQIITIHTSGEREYEAMKTAIASNRKILSVGVCDGTLGNSYQTPVRMDTFNYEVRALGIGKNYFETMGIKLVEGRYFNLENESDQKEGVIVNRAYLTKFGLTSPLEAVLYLHNEKRVILGVVENHVDALHRSKDPEPFVFYPAGKNQYVTMVVKTEVADLTETREYLETKWKEVFPTEPFECYYQTEIVMGNARQTNGNLQKVFLFITVLAGLLSGSGIFALASLNVAKRTKEIGVRKTLGASVNNIVGLLNREFRIVLFISAAVGSTAGYYAMEWLLAEIYAFRIGVGIVPVALCALAIFAIGIGTTSITIVKAARLNPVKTLRTE
ncbi:FtsX-like permease family protein [Chryseolinea sp. T2]|uniref:ABC transporter permease n=1 Tax=Chryseolinea sp. T2 TaxID=3129255 RepID=UPI003077CE36